METYWLVFLNTDVIFMDVLLNSARELMAWKDFVLTAFILLNSSPLLADWLTD